MKVPSWMKNADENEDMSIPTIARLDPPVASEPDEETRVVTQAAVLVNASKREREQLQVMNVELTLNNDRLKRENDSLRIDNAQLGVNVANLQNQIDEMRTQRGHVFDAMAQEVSDLRAFFSSLRAQMDHFEIPLPVRKRYRNGKAKDVGPVVAPAVDITGDFPGVQTPT